MKSAFSRLFSRKPSNVTGYATEEGAQRARRNKAQKGTKSPTSAAPSLPPRPLDRTSASAPSPGAPESPPRSQDPLDRLLADVRGAPSVPALGTSVRQAQDLIAGVNNRLERDCLRERLCRSVDTCFKRWERPDDWRAGLDAIVHLLRRDATAHLQSAITSMRRDHGLRWLTSGVRSAPTVRGLDACLEAAHDWLTSDEMRRDDQPPLKNIRRSAVRRAFELVASDPIAREDIGQLSKYCSTPTHANILPAETQHALRAFALVQRHLDAPLPRSGWTTATVEALDSLSAQLRTLADAVGAENLAIVAADISARVASLPPLSPPAAYRLKLALPHLTAAQL